LQRQTRKTKFPSFSASRVIRKFSLHCTTHFLILPLFKFSFLKFFFGGKIDFWSREEMRDLNDAFGALFVVDGMEHDSMYPSIDMKLTFRVFPE
jgi:hypothetical protein